MRTLFITSFHPLISRNIIATNIPGLLVQAGWRVVVLVPNYKKEYFESLYGSENILIEGIETGPSIRTRRVGMFKRLAEATPNTKRAAIGRKRTLSGALKTPLHYYFFYIPAGFFGKFLWFHWSVRALDFLISPRGRFSDVLKKYNPELIFATDVQNEHDVSLLQEARRAKIKILGMVRSWDNLTTRAFRIVPDHLLVHNEIIRDEAVTLYGIKKEKITVVGIPHYDKYLTRKPTEKKVFFHLIGADIKKPLILYIPLCDYRLKENSVDRYVMEMLGGLNANIVVRFPPAETVNIAGYTKTDNVFFDRPGHVFEMSRVGDRDLTREDDDRYMDLLSHASVVVGGPSTFAIDAALFDKPILLVDFYPKEVSEEEKIYEYGAEHFMHILDTQGVYRAKTKEDFLKHMEMYLKNSSLDHAGRIRIVSEQCWNSDGKSSDRVAQSVLK